MSLNLTSDFSSTVQVHIKTEKEDEIMKYFDINLR